MVFQSPTAGTAFITFDNVKVPVGNTLGPEGGGIFVMLRSGSSSTPTTPYLFNIP
jgi:alkylation response protein AidB-like acyl-CoA dehydrogenase